ncbi:MAG TPA: SDR family oxidoreductase [Acidobacteriota bacterium]|jgi:NAD(P)-dependent dehydrogenase (short-subunit alcohol dehydrogenase family)|nr:SDR family oxidoreductase [Acidobacteriota bacterium]HNR39234.1 SDR family oxidoreductase [Acidobacteriota bacterium]HNU01023.1 SDR family oxidoreductase [Acidobacteriota bacterium]HPB26698.1 SDR family oxidoreductase [Acidobacteriota bacterium]HQO25687.1 SDR family oxidoreductase [Acidobacteriota bacterium]
MNFNDTVALVTGSSRGIGAAIARAFARAGADVVINHRSVGGSSEARAGELAAEIQALGRQALVVPADIADREAVRALMAAVRKRFGRLDHLILNAARAPFKPMERLLDRELRDLVETNFVGQVRCLREALPLLEASGGRVVFVSSLGSRFYAPEYPLGAMKAAMETAVRHWAESLRPRGINANAVCGGIVRTDAFKVLRQVWDGLDRLPEELCVAPEEIADAVLFLCAPESRGVRGQTLVVDRGLGNRLRF